MDKKVLIISAAETFSIRGIEMKLKGMGIDASYSSPHIKELGKNCDGRDLLLLHTDEDIGDQADALVFLKDHCMEGDKQVIIIGTKAERDAAAQFLPEDCILAFFERPLDMDRLLDTVDEYFSDEAQHERRKRILIVDDDVAYMSMIFDWLKDRYRVSMANSGMQAITHLARHSADLILLDYEMPVTSGPQVLEMIRSETETSDIPVMFLTGKSDKESIMKVLALKPEDYLLKTIEREALREKLDNYFHTHKGRKNI